ncbi:hypothetical protein [Ornithinimicrobium cerasi]|uniref:hypothetical protein n=1 Tax=Ornithinimicrobium cerasi TaxID=2248773 RepID=UPI000BE4004C|nr:hypothetical protein [Ornithinimicrobium cerasi]
MGMWKVDSSEDVIRMPDQRSAQAARQAAREARARVREERVEREKRLARAGETVAVELARRDITVGEHERRAGEALRLMVHSEGLTVRDALRWCGVPGLSAREALQMMRRLDSDSTEGTQSSRSGDQITADECDGDASAP